MFEFIDIGGSGRFSFDYRVSIFFLRLWVGSSLV